ncbi:iron-sulfur cluster assembly protein IscA [Shewanella psychrotolerans]|uniref:iron-sulfur cluster assembly protein IscA n=1 Tax=Shewanella psychrotolerans TaxID=2864206 RepID=UPI001C6590D4|nr:iron-sulfur cluster assembly protein IscA [Shewanella psychrotolerans]QYK02853.1 iron-sulfur cluster assembly protein IscA [Shewanella psychrotolerans]
MAITMTPAAAERVKSFLASRGKGIGLRLGLKTSGCSGMAYVLEFVDDLNADDEVFDIDDVKIIIDAKSFIYLQGIELDFIKEGLNEGFQFNNPNAKGECGCGESFTV